MTIACASPDADLGVALRLSGYLDCQARALGENGFQALIGGPVATGLLSGLVTIFVALIGYRLILGSLPSLRDGVGWAARLGVVLALVTGWPAFQTLVYQVAIEAPGQLAAVILPAAGLPADNLDVRVQQAYDTIRLGSVTEPASEPNPPATSPSQPGPATPGQAPPRNASLGQMPLPQTASVFVLSTAGVTAALRIATGFLLAVGPLAVLTLLFDATLGIFSGWVRALAGTALATLAASIVTAVDLAMIESELARLQTYGAGGIAMTVDPQAITTLVLVFALVMLVAVLAAVRMAGAFRMPAIGTPFAGLQEGKGASMQTVLPATIQPGSAAREREPKMAAPSRVAAITDALASTVRREQGAATASATEAASRRASVLQGGRQGDAAPAIIPLGVAGRRAIGRRSLSAQRRDRTA